MVKNHIFYVETTYEFQINVIDERLRLCVCCCHEEDICKFTTNPDPSVVTKKLSNPKRKQSTSWLLMQEILKAIALYIINLYQTNN
jgi:hypothetical protein